MGMFYSLSFEDENVNEVLTGEFSKRYRPSMIPEYYVVVLLYKGEYYGHIYTWRLIGEHSDICMAVGIRGRVDLIFLGDRLQDLSRYLFEGVRMFALSKGCHSIVVPLPYEHMKFKLQNI